MLNENRCCELMYQLNKLLKINVTKKALFRIYSSILSYRQGGYRFYVKHML